MESKPVKREVSRNCSDAPWKGIQTRQWSKELQSVAFDFSIDSINYIQKI